MSAPLGDTLIGAAIDPVSGHAVPAPSHEVINEKIALKKELDTLEPAITPAPPPYDGEFDAHDKDDISEEVIIRTGADAAKHLLPMRDDGEPALTFRSIFLATCLAAFQAVMSQIYTVS